MERVSTDARSSCGRGGAQSCKKRDVCPRRYSTIFCWCHEPLQYSETRVLCWTTCAVQLASSPLVTAADDFVQLYSVRFRTAPWATDLATVVEAALTGILFVHLLLVSVLYSCLVYGVLVAAFYFFSWSYFLLGLFISWLVSYDKTDRKMTAINNRQERKRSRQACPAYFWATWQIRGSVSSFLLFAFFFTVASQSSAWTDP